MRKGEGAKIMMQKQIVLVTGCSSGIGKDLCEDLSSRGYIVVSSARKLTSLNDVPADLKVEIDVTDFISIQYAVKQILKEYGKIDILVNNAGYSTRGALEEIELSKVRNMFEVNVFGIMNMIQGVVPYMRKMQSGKIINIGSISGTFSQRVNGSYCASKFAVEAISDALRLELHDFNVQSTVIEPGGLQTNFFEKLEKSSEYLMKNQASPYYKLYRHDIEYRQKQKLTSSKKASQRICDIIHKQKLKPRYKVAVPFDVRIASLLPAQMREWALLH